ncbi:hypothetical protein VE00_09975 [Pseudogymnoascus sp. WSF 3629]|nr:hypothetical protein VE00_09975 [Pseudogymnoascus sp. WSF 3629]
MATDANESGCTSDFYHSPPSISTLSYAERNGLSSLPLPLYRKGKRAPRACTACRARKVRCNIVPHGAPCANCSHFGMACIELKKKTAGRRPASKKNEAGSPDSTIGEQEETRDVDSTEKVGSNSEIQAGLIEELSSPTSIHSDFFTRTDFASDSGYLSPPLPGAFTAFPCNLSSSDLSYLHSHDTFTLPNAAMQSELLKAYADFVHSQMPILDLEELLLTVKHMDDQPDEQRTDSGGFENSSRKQISFLLFQAVMYAGLGYLSTKALREAGFQSRSSAQTIFFNRVTLLYSFNTCDDRLSVIQSLLLMTLCASTSEARHWLRLATSFSQSLGLNCDVSSSNLPLRKKHLHHRIWWTAFLRDRILALGLSNDSCRTFIIKTEDCRIDLLSLEDFDLDESKLNHETIGAVKMRTDAILCVERVMLCWHSNGHPMSSFSPVDTRLTTAPQPIFCSSLDEWQFPRREHSASTTTSTPQSVTDISTPDFDHAIDIETQPSAESDVDREYVDFIEYLEVELVK